MTCSSPNQKKTKQNTNLPTAEWSNQMWDRHTMQYAAAKKVNETLPPVTTWMHLTGTCQRQEARHKKIPTVWFNLQKGYKQAKLTPGLEDRMTIPLGRRQGTVVGQACGGAGGWGAGKALFLPGGWLPRCAHLC